MWGPILLPLVLFFVSRVHAGNYNHEIDGIDDFQVSKDYYEPIVSAFVPASGKIKPGHDAFRGRVKNAETVSAFKAKSKKEPLDDGFRGPVYSTDDDDYHNEGIIVEEPIPGLLFEGSNAFPRYPTNPPPAEEDDDYTEEENNDDNPTYQTQKNVENQQEEVGESPVTVTPQHDVAPTSKPAAVSASNSDSSIYQKTGKSITREPTTTFASAVDQSVEEVSNSDYESLDQPEVILEDELQYAAALPKYSKKTTVERESNDIQFATPITRVLYSSKKDATSPVSDATVVQQGLFYASPPVKPTVQLAVVEAKEDNEIKYATPLPRYSKFATPVSDAASNSQEIQFAASPVQAGKKSGGFVVKSKDKVRYITSVLDENHAPIDGTVVQFAPAPYISTAAPLPGFAQQNEQTVQYAPSPLSSRNQPIAVVQQTAENAAVQFVPVLHAPTSAAPTPAPVQATPVSYVPAPATAEQTPVFIAKSSPFNSELQFVAASATPVVQQDEPPLIHAFVNHSPVVAASVPDVKHASAPVVADLPQVVKPDHPALNHVAPSFVARVPPAAAAVVEQDGPVVKYSAVPQSPVFAAPVAVANEEDVILKYVSAPPRIPDSPVYAAPIAVQEDDVDAPMKYVAPRFQHSAKSVSVVKSNQIQDPVVATPKPVLSHTPNFVQEYTSESVQGNTASPIQDPTSKPVQGRTPKPVLGHTPAPHPGQRVVGDGTVTSGSTVSYWPPTTVAGGVSTTTAAPQSDDIPDIEEVISLGWHPKDAPCFKQPDFVKLSTGPCKRHYVECHQNKAVSQFCDGLFKVFCNASKSCVPKASTSECKPSIILPPADAISDEPLVDALRQASFCVRRKDGIYRHPINCSRIVHCFGNDQFEYPSCAHNLAFDESTGSCNYRDQVQGCSVKGENLAVLQQTPSQIDADTSVRNTSTGVASTTGSTATGAQPVTSGCNGWSHGDHVPNVADCSKFFRCVWDRLVPMNCPPSTVFNANLGVCDWPDRVDCQASSRRARL